MSIHKAAAEGFQVGADTYDKGRPDYPQAAVDFLISTFGLTSKTQVLDLAAGTGKWTRALFQRGIPVWAVEPVEGMRNLFSERLPQIPITEGTAEKIPVDTGVVHAVTVAQAFHWFDGKKALEEIARVLIPRGRLGLLWNVRDESVPWVRLLSGILAPYETGVPRYHTGEWKKAFLETSLFTPLLEKHFQHVQQADVETVIARIASVSFIARLPPSELALVKTRVRDLLAAHCPSEKFEFPYHAEVFWCQKSA
jgi:ubiquinone/menaquinone biosynthesis C-methylase UbiE